MIKKKIARRYTLALYEAALATKTSEKIRADLLSIRKLIDSSRELKLFLQTPIINTEKKKNIIKLLFSKKVNPLTLSLLELLTEKQRENHLYDICLDYINLMNEKNGILEADIRTAVKLSDKEKKKYTDILKDYTGKTISASYEVDESIKGGIVARFSDTIIDASIKRQLEILRTKLTEGSFLGG
jgi:F-type H+-transporting ATPase subunit delta